MAAEDFRIKILLLTVIVGFALLTPIVLARYVGTHTIVSEPQCQKCHQDILAEQGDSDPTSHRGMDCLNCHSGDIHSYVLPTEFGAMSAVCGGCHSTEYSAWQTGSHYLLEVECWHCHTNWTGELRP